jgi:hypothetical protein
LKDRFITGMRITHVIAANDETRGLLREGSHIETKDNN